MNTTDVDQCGTKGDIKEQLGNNCTHPNKAKANVLLYSKNSSDFPHLTMICEKTSLVANRRELERNNASNWSSAHGVSMKTNSKEHITACHNANY